MPVESRRSRAGSATDAAAASGGTAPTARASMCAAADAAQKLMEAKSLRGERCRSQGR